MCNDFCNIRRNFWTLKERKVIWNFVQYRCGSVHNKLEKMTYFINGLHPWTNSIFVRFWERQPRRSLGENQLVQFARYERNVFRAQACVAHNLRPFRRPRDNNTSAASLISNSGDEPEPGIFSTWGMWDHSQLDLHWRNTFWRRKRAGCVHRNWPNR